MKTKHNFLILLLTVFYGCSNTKQPETVLLQTVNAKKIEVNKPELQFIIDSSNVEGSVLIFDPQKQWYYSNDFKWAETGKLPASTFKIPNSIIALESGVVKDHTTLFKWKGEKRRLAVWEKDMNFREAFHLSCVPCYQEIARKIGSKRMQAFLKKFEYGNMVVDSNTIDVFWLEGDSKISQFQQIDFLKRFYDSKLPISPRTEKIMKELMVIDSTVSYTISGKTGWSIRNGNNNGWFVGYIEKGPSVWFFATNVEAREKFNMEMFPMIRKEITMNALKVLKIIQ